MKTLLVSLACMVLLSGCAAKSADHMNWHERRQAEFDAETAKKDKFDWDMVVDTLNIMSMTEFLKK